MRADKAAAGTILLADDDEITKLIIARHLELLGHEVFAVENGLQALDYLRRKRPGLIVTDLWMQFMDGFELIQAVRLKSEYNAIPIVAVSTASEEKYRLRALKLGAASVFEKSSGIKRICREISRLAGAASASPAAD